MYKFKTELECRQRPGRRQVHKKKKAHTQITMEETKATTSKSHPSSLSETTFTLFAEVTYMFFYFSSTDVTLVFFFFPSVCGHKNPIFSYDFQVGLLSLHQVDLDKLYPIDTCVTWAKTELLWLFVCIQVLCNRGFISQQACRPGHNLACVEKQNQSAIIEACDSSKWRDLTTNITVIIFILNYLYPVSVKSPVSVWPHKLFSVV